MKTIKRYGRVITAVAVLLVLAAAMVVCLMPIVRAEPVDQYHTGWNLVRAKASQDGDTFAAVYDRTGVSATLTCDYDGMDDTGVALGGAFRIPSRSVGSDTPYAPGTKWVFVICGNCFNDTDDTFSFNVVGWARGNGMQQNICEGNGVLGTQAVVKYPDGGDALGELVSLTGVAYTHASETFTLSNSFDDVVAGMMARVTGTGFTSEIVNITTVTGNDSVVCDITTSTGNGTDATIQINPAFWADTIAIDEQTKWPGYNGTVVSEPGVGVFNSGDNEVAMLVIDLAGLEYIQFVFYDCDAATGEEAGNLKVYGRPY
jgi:hypothetical protein